MAEVMTVNDPMHPTGKVLMTNDGRELPLYRAVGGYDVATGEWEPENLKSAMGHLRDGEEIAVDWGEEGNTLRNRIQPDPTTSLAIPHAEPETGTQVAPAIFFFVFAVVVLAVAALGATHMITEAQVVKARTKTGQSRCGEALGTHAQDLPNQENCVYVTCTAHGQAADNACTGDNLWEQRAPEDDDDSGSWLDPVKETTATVAVMAIVGGAVLIGYTIWQRSRE